VNLSPTQREREVNQMSRKLKSVDTEFPVIQAVVNGKLTDMVVDAAMKYIQNYVIPAGGTDIGELSVVEVVEVASLRALYTYSLELMIVNSHVAGCPHEDDCPVDNLLQSLLFSGTGYQQQLRKITDIDDLHQLLNVFKGDTDKLFPVTREVYNTMLHYLPPYPEPL
jgi:hypothetical protein